MDTPRRYWPSQTTNDLIGLDQGPKNKPQGANPSAKSGTVRLGSCWPPGTGSCGTYPDHELEAECLLSQIFLPETFSSSSQAYLYHLLTQEASIPIKIEVYCNPTLKTTWLIMANEEAKRTL